MYFKLCIAALATAMIMSSCEWLFPKNNSTARYNIEGKWKIDSIAPDSAALGYVFALMAINNQDSSHREGSSEMVYNFADGKIISSVDDLPIDSGSYDFDSKKLSFKTKEGEQFFAFEPISDSSFKITDKDSVTMFYRKVK